LGTYDQDRGPGGAPKDGSRVKCLAGENACPPEYVGGAYAYFDFLAAIKDPAHEEHRMMLDWSGGSFDPVAFNIDDVNKRLAGINF
jgi:hypothetical protein